MNIIEYIGEENEREILFIRGHLYLENLMVEIIKKVYQDSNAALEVGKMFYNKVKLLKAVDTINSEMETLLLGINKVRNKMAHQLLYKVSFEDFFELVQLAHRANVDFSDHGIFQDKEYSRKVYFTDNCGVIELISNTFSQLAFIENIFTQDEISEILC